MKPRLLDLLVCPIQKTPLEMLAWESTPIKLSAGEISRIERLGVDPALFSAEITTGVLLNRSRKIFYPIHRGIPRMLVFPTAITRYFIEAHRQRIACDIPGFELPREMAMPGEEAVLRTFSNEWINYDWDDESYWGLSPDVMYKTMNFLLDLVRRPVKDKLVLEVGIGIGGIADYMASKEECEIVGMDLSYSVDPAYAHFGRNSFLHIVQGSAFTPPFRENSFDLVYSIGVLHHTFSTKNAFDSICKLPKHFGRLYVWVYSHYDEERTLERRLLMKLERLIRPVVWRLPNSLIAENLDLPNMDGGKPCMLLGIALLLVMSIGTLTKKSAVGFLKLAILIFGVSANDKSLTLFQSPLRLLLA
jgi:uncharacterized protein YbaR (Trm112 family)/SAM-dependent methyltransferase